MCNWMSLAYSKVTEKAVCPTKIKVPSTNKIAICNNSSFEYMNKNAEYIDAEPFEVYEEEIYNININNWFQNLKHLFLCVCK